MLWKYTLLWIYKAQIIACFYLNVLASLNLNSSFSFMIYFHFHYTVSSTNLLDQLICSWLSGFPLFDFNEESTENKKDSHSRSEMKVCETHKWMTVYLFYYPSCPQDCAISHLYLHGDCDFLLCVDQCGVLHCDVCRGAPGLAGSRCGKQ